MVYLLKMVIFDSYVKLPEGHRVIIIGYNQRIFDDLPIQNDDFHEHLPYLPTNSPPPWRRLQDPACRLRFLRHEQTTGLMAAKLTGGREASNKPNGAKG